LRIHSQCQLYFRL